MKSIFTIVCIIGLDLLKSFFIAKMWDWFVVALFPSAPLLSTPIVFGLLMMKGIVIPDKTHDREWGDLLEDCLKWAIIYAMLFGMGYIAYLFV